MSPLRQPVGFEFLYRGGAEPQVLFTQGGNDASADQGAWFERVIEQQCRCVDIFPAGSDQTDGFIAGPAAG